MDWLRTLAWIIRGKGRETLALAFGLALVYAFVPLAVKH